MSESPDEDDLIAQALGFSSFGTANPPSKKRRYNPRADATSEDYVPAATGANSTPVGTTKRNDNEISLDDDNDEEPSVVQVSHESSLPQRPARSAYEEQKPAFREQRPRSDTWYIGYYDPSTNENPWDRLEQACGLEARGTWLERNSGANRHSTTDAS